MTSSLGRSTTTRASHSWVRTTTSLPGSTVRAGEAGRQEEDDGPSTSTRAAAVAADNSYLLAVPLMLAGLGLFHYCLYCGADSVEEATVGVAIKLCGLVLVLFPVALVAFLLAQGFPLPKAMCVWKMPLFSETPCAVFENARAHTYAKEPTVERWVTMASWGLANVSYNLLAGATAISLILVGTGALVSGLSFCSKDHDGTCAPLLLGLAAAAALLAMGALAFAVLLGATVAAMLLFASLFVLAASLVMVPCSAFYAAMLRSSSQALRGSASVATGWWRSLPQLAMVLLAWAGGSVGFVADLCNVTTSLQTWLQGGCGSQVGCEAFSVVGEWLLQAFPWLPSAVKWLFVEYQEAFDFAYRAARSLGMLLQLECDGLRGLLLTSLLCAGMSSIYLLQASGTTEALARLRTHAELAPRIHRFVLLGTCQFISTRLTELFITMGNGAFIHAVTYSAAFLAELPGSNPACVSGPDGFLGVVSLPFLWSATLLSLYYLFDLVFKVYAEDEAQQRGPRNSIDNLGAAALTSLGLWHDHPVLCGSNMRLLKIEETVAKVQKEEAAKEGAELDEPGWSRAFAKNLMLAYADFLSTSLMVLPLGVVLGKFAQCCNAGSLLARTSLPLPKNGPREHLQKLLALLRFLLLLLTPLVPESDAPSLLAAGVALVGLEALLKAEPPRCLGAAAKVEPCP